MTQTNKSLKIIAATIVVGIVISVVAILTQNAPRAQGEITSAGCKPQVSQRMTIGHQTSVQLVATSSNRATVRIQQPDNATNTVYLRLDQGASSTVLTGTHILEKVSATGTVRSITVGKNTDEPYTGAITAITDAGTSTILVYECVY